MKGFDLILERIKADPFKATLRFRYLALVADLPDPMEKAHEVLKLAEFYKLDFPREALQTAYLVCRYDPKNLKAVQIIIEILETQNRLPQASFMREYKAKIDSQKDVTSNQFFGDISRSGLFDSSSVDESLTFNPGEEFLADQLSGEFSNANESKLISLLSIDSRVKQKSPNASSTIFEITPIDLTGAGLSQASDLGADPVEESLSSKVAPMAPNSQGSSSLYSPSNLSEGSPSPLMDLPSSLTPPSSLIPPSSLTPPANLVSSKRPSLEAELSAVPNSKSLSTSVEASLDLTFESQESTFVEALPDGSSSGSKITNREFSNSTSWGIEDSSVGHTALPYVEQLDVSSREVALSHQEEVADRALDFEDSGQVHTQLYSPRLDLMEVEEVEDKTFLSHNSSERKWASESPLKGDETVVSRSAQVQESFQEQEGSEEGEERLGEAKVTFALSSESAANYPPAEGKDSPATLPTVLKEESFAAEVEQSIAKEFDSSYAESRNKNQTFGPQSTTWWQQALESHSNKTTLGRLEMDPESFSYFLLENLREHKSPYEVIRRSLSTEQKNRLFSYFLNISTPGMELLKIDIFMAVGAGLEAVQLIREYTEQGEIELSSLVQRARVLWQVLGWQPFLWQGQEGREEFKRILFLRPSQRPSLEML
ncbi:MAG: hypothetical protein WCI18_05130 [Pseudomonadota bacterium]